jgi:hypothetical protein
MLQICSAIHLFWVYCGMDFKLLSRPISVPQNMTRTEKESYFEKKDTDGVPSSNYEPSSAETFGGIYDG